MLRLLNAKKAARLVAAFLRVSIGVHQAVFGPLAVWPTLLVGPFCFAWQEELCVDRDDEVLIQRQVVSV